MTLKKILIIGANGQLGTSLTDLLENHHEYPYTAWGGRDYDLTTFAQLKPKIEAVNPDVIINAAAYTQVDKAEQAESEAMAVNAEAVKHLAALCAETNTRLIHVSTDYVFPGNNPYFQSIHEPTQPINVYGASKLAGEQALFNTKGLDWTCFRTAWLYSNKGHNFLNTMLKLMTTGKPIRVVTDQIGSPTSSDSLAQAIVTCLDRPRCQEIHHWTDSGVASWYDFAVQIQETALAAKLLSKCVDIQPITTAAYPTPAKRPSISLLCKEDTNQALGIQAPHWHASLQSLIEQRTQTQQKAASAQHKSQAKNGGTQI